MSISSGVPHRAQPFSSCSSTGEPSSTPSWRIVSANYSNRPLCRIHMARASIGSGRKPNANHLATNPGLFHESPRTPQSRALFTHGVLATQIQASESKSKSKGHQSSPFLQGNLTSPNTLSPHVPPRDPLTPSSISVISRPIHKNVIPLRLVMA